MELIQKREDFLSYRESLGDVEIGFVPTMGALHEGHLSLYRRSTAENKKTLASLFVNPTQFDQSEDLATYPSQTEKDLELLKGVGCDAVFMPKKEELYPEGYVFQVAPLVDVDLLCGKSRPGHFEGVLTIVLKLFQLVRPKKAYFGEKDFQQLRLIQKMAEDFFLPLEVVPCPTVRESDGLAMSSRNLRLTQEDRLKASLLYRALKMRDLTDSKKFLDDKGFKIDYLQELWGRRFVAVSLNGVRLIDNVSLEETLK